MPLKKKGKQKSPVGSSLKIEVKYHHNKQAFGLLHGAPRGLDGGGSTPGFGDDDELLVRASAVLKSQGQKTGPVGDPVRKRFGPLPLHHQNLCLSLFELQGQLAMYSAAGAGLRPKAC